MSGPSVAYHMYTYSKFHIITGVERTNPDLVMNYVSHTYAHVHAYDDTRSAVSQLCVNTVPQNADGSHDFNSNDKDPSPNLKAHYDNSHGTK